MAENRRGLFGRFRGGETDAAETDAGIAEPPAPPAGEAKTGWLKRLRAGLTRSSSALTGSISSIFTKRKLDEETLEEFEEALIRADLGVETANFEIGAKRRQP